MADRNPDAPGFGLVALPNVIDARGNLTVGEFGRHVPFEAKRYFIVYQVPLVEVRGEHAHRACHQFLVCVRGRMSVVGDDGRERRQYVLDRPDQGFYMPPMTWGGQFDYSPCRGRAMSPGARRAVARGMPPRWKTRLVSRWGSPERRRCPFRRTTLARVRGCIPAGGATLMRRIEVGVRRARCAGGAR